MNTDQSLAHLVRSLAKTKPDSVAFTFENGDQSSDSRLTYHALWERSLAVATGLKAKGLVPGQHFALVMANHREFVECMVAAGICGAVFVPLDPRMPASRLAFSLRHAQCKGVVAADYAIAAVEEAVSDFTDRPWLVSLDSGELAGLPRQARFADQYKDLVDSGSSDTEILARADQSMQLIFTSGTTGNPKGILMTHGRFIVTSKLAAAAFGYTTADRLYTGLSLTHANAQLVTVGAALTLGIEAVISRWFSRSRLWSTAKRLGCTTFTLLGGMTSAIYSAPPSAGDRDHKVRLVVSAGMPASIWKKFESRFGVNVLEFWGTAEGGLLVNPVGVGPVGSIGRDVAGFAHRIVDDDGEQVATGQMGELLIGRQDGQPIVVEYFNDPRASAKKCVDGWMRSGDIVHENDEGWLFFHHRKGAGIRRNGEFISTSLVEKVIAESGLVQDVYVYGVTKPGLAPGEKLVVAAVVPLKPQSFSAEKLRKAINRLLEKSQVPDIIQVLTDIPKTASEKPQDRFLIELLERNSPHQGT